MSTKILCMLAIPLVISACAGPATNAGEDNMQEERTYVTGSNLPQRSTSNVKRMSKEELEEMRRNATMPQQNK
ncbi:hypothetical protein [Undibacterium terreum]|nr:hypothetical protein [Undibacterium terreum]